MVGKGVLQARGLPGWHQPRYAGGIIFTGFRLLPIDKDGKLRYNRCMRETVLIRVRKETRERLHSAKNPGQTLDGIITQLIDLWKKQKRLEDVGATDQEK